MDITNAGKHQISIFEPPENEWRPFIVNFNSEKPGSGMLAGIQSMLFTRLLERIHGTFVFPAIGSDRAFLRSGTILSIAPHNAESSVGSSRMIHIKAKIEDVPTDAIASALDQLQIVPNQDRALICKGLQSLLPPAEIVGLVNEANISKIVVFSSACCGLVGHSAAVPYESPALSALFNELYVNVTDRYFTHHELRALGAVHSLMHANYAWKSGHFPATKVEVFEND